MKFSKGEKYGKNRKMPNYTQKYKEGKKMGKKAEMTIQEAAKVIHKSMQYVRLGLQQQRLPFGSAVQKPNGKWSYDIIPKKVYEYEGIEEGCETNG